MASLEKKHGPLYPYRLKKRIDVITSVPCMTKDVTLRASLMVAGGGTSYAVRTRSPVTSRAAVVYAHKNETIDVITSKDYTEMHGQQNIKNIRCNI